MRRTFKFQILPNASQERRLVEWLELCAGLYNQALGNRVAAYRATGKGLSYNTQSRHLTVLRGASPVWSNVPVKVARSALRRLDRAFQAFFRRVKAGQKPGFPRFRSRGAYDSFSFPAQKNALRGNRVHVPLLGHVKVNLHREMTGDIKEVTVRRGVGGRWWVCFSCDLGEAPPKVAVRSAVGIDLGLESFATLTDGSVVENPRYFRRGAEVLAARQRRLARAQRDSRGRERAKVLVAKAHAHVANQRRDHGRKVVVELFRRFDLVAYEDLNVRGMVHGNLAKSIHDAAWGQFIHDLTCKAESAGKHAVAVDPRGTSQRCSACGAVVQKSLGDREHACACGLVVHRDLNAARNILALGLSAVAV